MFRQILIILFVFLLTLGSYVHCSSTAHGQPYLIKVNDQTHIIGNDLWNLTIGHSFGTRLLYKSVDLVGNASGHYVSYNGAANNLSWTHNPPSIFKKTDEYTDIVFQAREGDLHWVLTPDLAGAYQYFVNRALPTLGEFRTLWRLDNATFTHGHTSERDEALVPLRDIRGSGAKKVQDETWQRADGSFITKYDLSTFLPNVEGDLSFWGVYGPLGGKDGAEKVGSWYIHGGKDYLNGDHLKQELIVHRESITGDAVQLNMIHGTHFQAYSSDAFPVGKTWGPWLWYLNNGSAADAAARAKQENTAWPYKWLHDDLGYDLRGSVSGHITLSNGRPASGAAVFLGDNHPNRSTLDQGAWYYYRTYANQDGYFTIPNVREGRWNIQAWPNGGAIGNVTTVLSKDDVSTKNGTDMQLGELKWPTQERKLLWQVGQIDRKATGFAFSGPPHQHARQIRCPANLTYEIGKSHAKDWCFAQWSSGNWSIRFDITALDMQNIPQVSSSIAAVLSVSLAGYSAGVGSSIMVNNSTVGRLSAGKVSGDPSLYRSGTLAGEWRLFEFPVEAGALKEGWNTVDFVVTKSEAWRGYMFDSILLEWA